LAVVQEYLRDLDRVSAIPLDERADREGTGDFRVLSVSLESDGAPVSTFRCGAEATLRLVIENRTSRELRNIHIAVGIDNEIGQRVAILDTELIGPGIPSITPGTESVSFIIPKMPLIPGRYRLTLCSEVSRGIADYIKNAATFDVELGDFYGTGRLPQPGQGQGMFHPDFCFVSGRPNDIDRGAPSLHRSGKMPLLHRNEE
jgi:lipopolysaccharide transport system ATP-binding protein